MPIYLSSNVVPKSGGKWPIVEDIYIRGGVRVVANIAARDAIYLDSGAKNGLKTGMLVITADTNRIWQYIGTGQYQEVKKQNTFIYSSAQERSEWNIQHNRNSVHFTYSIFDDNGFQILPDECQIIDLNNLKLLFSTPITGTATFIFV